MLAVLDFAIAKLEAIKAKAEAIGLQVDQFISDELAQLKALRDKIAAVVNPSVEPASLAMYSSAGSSLSKESAAAVEEAFEAACPEA